MEIKDIFLNRILLVGCGKMGSALLDGWIKNGLSLHNVFVMEPNPSKRLSDLAEKGLNLNCDYAFQVGTCVLAVKPQNIDNLLDNFPNQVNFSLLISVIAGTPIEKFKAKFGEGVNIFRVMPNTPSLVSAGITAIYGEGGLKNQDLESVDLLMTSVGETVRLVKESDIDIATAISGSGPAYVFLLIEAMVSAGVDLGLSKEICLKLAKGTLFGAGKLSLASHDGPETLRKNVTSPGGTTAAALDILMRDNSFESLMKSAISAAHKRSLELRK